MRKASVLQEEEGSESVNEASSQDRCQE